MTEDGAYVEVTSQDHSESEDEDDDDYDDEEANVYNIKVINDFHINLYVCRLRFVLNAYMFQHF